MTLATADDSRPTEVELLIHEGCTKDNEDDPSLEEEKVSNAQDTLLILTTA